MSESSESTNSEQNDENLGIHSLTFSCGNRKDQSNLEIECENIVILVGPNNSGKSSTLKEIEQFCMNDANFQMKILNNIQFSFPQTDLNIGKLLNEFQTTKIPSNIRLDENEICIAVPDFRGRGEAAEHQKINVVDFVANCRARGTDYFRQTAQFLKYFSIRLDGRTRFNLLSSKLRGDMQQSPGNPLAQLFTNDKLSKKIDDIIYKEFHWHFYLDHSPAGGFLKIVLSKDILNNRRSISDKEIDFFKKSTDLTVFGDGIQVYVGILIALLSLPHRIILLDEPEAFLHPPKARTLGSNITSITQSNSSLIVSTHSPEFLLGCLDESTDVTIIRLTYDEDVGTTRRLESDDVKLITTDPLLRSTDTISALFHLGAIVTESDGDRVFYSEINRRLLEKSLGIEDGIFLNSQGRDTIHRLFEPLRKIGIPAAAIYDLDSIIHKEFKYEKTTFWETILKAAKVPESELSKLEEKRGNLEKNLSEKTTKDLNPFKREGIQVLDGTQKSSAEELLEDLKKYGIFILPVGELEAWPKSLVGESFAKGSSWLVNILEKLDEINPKPTDSDVWKFIKDINTWITNPDRLGIDSTENLLEEN